ncbi:MAG: helix-turn-helix transcriptional regulator [Clostridiaceae bacterium]|nr:helix-turn-helix transcriptional regulator [Clostridiaceae bacterium]
MFKSLYRKFANSKYYLKLYLSVFVVSVISVIVLTLFMFYFFKDKTINILNRMNILELHNTETVFNNYIDAAKRSAMELYQNPTLKTIMLTGDKDWSGNYYNAVSHTRSIITANKFVNSIYYFNNDGIVFNVTNKTESYDSQKKLFDLVKNNSVLNNPIIWDLNVLNYNNQIRTMTVFFHEGVSNDGAIDCAVAINIDLNELKNSIFSKQAENGMNVFIISDEGDIVIQWGNSNTNLNSEDLSRIITTDKSYDIFKSVIDNHEVNILTVPSENNKFFIVSVMDYNQSISDLIKTRNVLIISCLSIILVIIVISTIITKKVYRPIGNIFDNVREYVSNSSVKSKNMDEVQMISNTLNGMVERINSLEKVNEKNTIVKMITSDNLGSSTAEEIIKKTGILKSYEKPYVVIAIKIDDFARFKERNNAEALSFQLNSICTMSSDLFKQIAYVSAYQVSDDGIVIFLSEMDFNNKLYKNKIISTLSDLQSTISRIFHISVTCGISSIANNAKEITHKYKEALGLTKYRVLLGNGGVYSPQISSSLDNSDIPEKYINDAVNAVKKASLEDYNDSIDHLFEQCKKHVYKKSIIAMSKLTTNVYRIVEGIQAEGDTDIGFDYADVYNKLYSFEDSVELRSWFTSLYDETRKLLDDINEKGIHDIVTEAIDYINETYMDPQLSLNSMAEKLSISPWYFSRIFNEVTGTSFPDYINNLKLNKAKDLLTEDMNSDINDIAKKVGYNSSTYFTTLFKKKFGLSPSKFRNNSKI